MPVDIAQFRLSDLRYDAGHHANKAAVMHNYTDDYQLVLCEPQNSEKIHKVIADTKYFAAVGYYRLLWHKEKLEENLERLMIKPAPTLMQQLAVSVQQEIQIDVIIVKAEQPQYLPTASANITANNTVKNTGSAYQLCWPDSLTRLLTNYALAYSSSIERFFYLASLLLTDNFIQPLKQPSSTVVPVMITRKNLQGTCGWKDFTEMFHIANQCADWLVLRNAEFLPDDFWGNDKDIDVLCSRLIPFLHAINAKHKNAGDANYEVTVADQQVDVDARYVGDEYYDKDWQKSMLEQKQYQGVVPILNSNNAFYSLLYHARVHKPIVKLTYVSKLKKLADESDVIFDDAILTDDKATAHFLDQFLINQQYQITLPTDYACYENINRKVLRHSRQVKPSPVNMLFLLKRWRHQLFLLMCRLSPRRAKDFIKRVVNG